MIVLDFCPKFPTNIDAAEVHAELVSQSFQKRNRKGERVRGVLRMVCIF